MNITLLKHYYCCSLVLLNLLFASLAFADQNLPIHNNQTVQAHLSQHNETRVYVQGDRIVSLHGTPGAYFYKNDNQNGQVYLMPTPPFQNKPFSVFLTTEKGHTYGLHLVPTEALSETIALIPQSADVPKAAHWEQNAAYPKILVALLREIVSTQTPEGYRVIVLKKQKPQALGNILWVTPLVHYQGAHLQGMIYRVTNRTRHRLQISEREFYQPHVRAIALALHQLPAHGSTRLFEVR